MSCGLKTLAVPPTFPCLPDIPHPLLPKFLSAFQTVLNHSHHHLPENLNATIHPLPPSSSFIIYSNLPSPPQTMHHSFIVSLKDII